MDDLRQAYERMGLPENSSREELEKRYTTLMRQARSRQQASGTSSAAEDTSFAEINEAYRYILGYEERQAAEEFNKKEYGKYRGMAGSAQKLDHFWRYYKFHTLGVIAIIAAIIYGAMSYADHRAEQRYLASLPPIDLSINFMGSFYLPEGKDDASYLETEMLKPFPEWKRLAVQVNQVSFETTSQMDVALQQKALLNLVTEKPDIYIMDKGTFDWLSPQGILINLDAEAEGAWKPFLSGGTASVLKQRTEDVPEEHIYAINISQTKLAKELTLLKREMIVGIRADSKHPEQAKQFIETYLQTK
ncbi:J domain-containing protein [Paenibacillus sp. GCM10023252]|uniref:J domain-containing protein n=1 Tax=Paenibacillus sp. GCM10023252 TaxID=3252649 RepID=UPI0036146AD5